MQTIKDVDWDGKTAVLRADLNVPLTPAGEVADDARLVAVKPTIEAICNRGGKVLVLSHLGRPQEGGVNAALSLRVVADALARILGQTVDFAPEELKPMAMRQVVTLMENTRFNVGESVNDASLARRYADYGDVFVMDAFASAHRAEASVVGIGDYLPSCAGLLLEKELNALSRVLEEAQRPLVGVFGGAKMSGKLAIIRRMAALCDTLIVGGGIANTLLLARGDNIGASLAQPDMLDTARELLSAGDLLLPQDAVAASQATAEREARHVTLAALRSDEMILDIGEKTRAACRETLMAAKTIIWNGPLGLFERPAFAAGTAAVAKAVADSAAFSLVGGGDTIAAVRQFKVADRMSYVSTGGGALLEYLAGDPLPGLAVFD